MEGLRLLRRMHVVNERSFRHQQRLTQVIVSQKTYVSTAALKLLEDRF